LGHYYWGTTRCWGTPFTFLGISRCLCTTSHTFGALRHNWGHFTLLGALPYCALMKQYSTLLAFLHGTLLHIVGTRHTMSSLAGTGHPAGCRKSWL
jgi:hypothetical protein